MIVDVDQVEALPAAEDYDVCIAGAGVAGIVLAKALVERGRRVLLLEAGGLDYTEESQSIYRGDCIGRDYFDLDVARLRFLGGTSNHWHGWCRPLDEHDFVKRDHIDESGWPIGIGDLQPYLSNARGVLEIESFPQEAHLPSSDNQLKEIFFRLSPPVRFKDKYLEFLKSSEALNVCINANLVRLDIDEESNRISGFFLRGYRNDALEHEVTANNYVLSMGGIENARALLNANHQRSVGLGNESDLVGRFFMEHPHHLIGWYIADPARATFGKDNVFVAPTLNMIKQEQIANCGLRLLPMREDRDRSLMTRTKDLAKEILCASDIIADFARSVSYFYCPIPPEAGLVYVASEQVPNRNSRIQLIDEKDRFGLRRIVLDWQLSPVDKKTIRAVGMTAGRYLAEQNIGRIKLDQWVLEEDEFIPGLQEKQPVAGYHHLGTTRMGSSKEDGVVDLNCRVFGVENLYIAGSSVFRTGGHANPTLTIVQLTLRLADHLSNM